MDVICAYQAKTLIEALMMKEHIEEHGIVCIMPNEHISNVIPHYSNVTGGFRLLVSKDDYDLVRDLLVEVSNRKTESSANSRVDVDQCPHCESEEIVSFLKPRRIITILGFLLATIPVPAWKDMRKCTACGKTWTKRAPNKSALEVSAS